MPYSDRQEDYLRKIEELGHVAASWKVTKAFGISNAVRFVDGGLQISGLNLDTLPRQEDGYVIHSAIQLPYGAEIFLSLLMPGSQAVSELSTILQGFLAEGRNNNVVVCFGSDGRLHFRRVGFWTDGFHLDPESPSLVVEKIIFSCFSNGRASPGLEEAVNYVRSISQNGTLDNIQLWQTPEIEGAKSVFRTTIRLPKPFLILAGPSGTGKSRWVRQKAYESWSGPEKPLALPNYKLIPVKPNWHDSSELLGYVTRLGLKASELPRFVVTDFVRFLVDAWKTPTTPFWLCLDEMNLAPVEQYFAEYLSVVETRKVIGDSIVTDALIPPSAFLDVDWTDFCKHVALEPTDPIAAKIKADGLSLPPNLIVVGTVNMDETTHSFSRKVLDRAFVWEMPIGDLGEGWDVLGYPEETPPVWKPLLATGGDEARRMLKAERGDLPEAWLGTEDTTKAVVAWLKKVNEVLEGTPFKVSYRVRDELLLLALARGVTTVDALRKVLDDGLYSKILPRIEGDVVRTQKALVGLGKLLLDFAELAEDPEWSQIFPADSRQELDLQKLSNAPSGPNFMFGTESWPPDPFAPALPWRRSLNKIRSMLLKLEGQFTSYWD